MVDFNWYELCQKSNYHFEGILVLTYALTKGYNNRIAWNAQELKEALKIDVIPNILFERKALVTNRYGGIHSTLTVEDPQCYFRNKNWLKDKISPISKIAYLYILSQRSIANRNNFVYDKFVPTKLWNNPYISHKLDKLWLTPELLQ